MTPFLRSKPRLRQHYLWKWRKLHLRQRNPQRCVFLCLWFPWPALWRYYLFCAFHKSLWGKKYKSWETVPHVQFEQNIVIIKSAFQGFSSILSFDSSYSCLVFEWLFSECMWNASNSTQNETCNRAHRGWKWSDPALVALAGLVAENTQRLVNLSPNRKLVLPGSVSDELCP